METGCDFQYMIHFVMEHSFIKDEGLTNKLL